MASEISIQRRAFLGGVAALGAMQGFRMPAHAAVSPSVSNLPTRSNVVIRSLRDDDGARPAGLT